MWSLIVSIPDHCPLSYFACFTDGVALPFRRDVFCFCFVFHSDKHHCNPKKGELLGCIELLSDLQINDNLVP